MSQERVLARVRKLFALANDTAASQGERDNALRMAYATLAKHNLDVEALGGATVAEEERVEHVVTMNQYPWARSIAQSIAKLFFCSYYFSRSSTMTGAHYFLGRKSNAITASELSQHVVSSVFKELRKRYGGATTPAARSFATGVASAIYMRCDDLRTAAVNSHAPDTAAAVLAADGAEDGAADEATSSSRALVLASLYETEEQANKAMLSSLYPDMKSSKSTTKAVGGRAYAEGFAHGKTVGLAPQVGTASKAKQLR